VLIDRRSLNQHLPWIIFASVTTVAALVWYFVTAQTSARWPGGSSVPGFTYGVIGGSIMLFEFFLWPRKKLRTWRIGRAQVWMRAHIWLGLLTVPLIVLHSGFRFGESLSATLMVLFLVVIASGLWGLAFQQLIPKRMLNEVPGETIYSQIDRAIGFLVSEAEQVVISACGERMENVSAVPRTVSTNASQSSETHITVGAMRKVGRTQGKVLITVPSSEPIQGSEWLGDLYDRKVADYLKHGRESKSPLALPSRASAIFQEVRTRVSPDTLPAVDLLEDFCGQRRQFDRQRRMHHWLHGWLLVHLPLSVALIVLMLVHIVVTLKYW